jgi:thioredoxin reductase (NADPH)
MTRPIQVPLYGPVKLRETTKEALIDLWSKIITTTGVDIMNNTDVTDVRRAGRHFRVETSRGVVHCRRVLLAIGRAGTPRKLGLPGEEQENVAYRMIGGDVACEVALMLAEQPGTEVTMLYRGDKLTRPKPANRQLVEQARRDGRLRVGLGAQLERLGQQVVFRLNGRHKRYAIQADQVFVCAGGVPPSGFLRQLGVNMIMKHGEA